MWDITKDVDIVHKDFDAWINFEIINPDTGEKVDFQSWQVKLYGFREKLLSSDPSIIEKIDTGKYRFHYIPENFSKEYELFLSILGNIDANNTFFHNRLIKPLSPTVLRHIVLLRNQIDKAMKSLGKKIDELQYFDNKEALDSFWRDFPIGYTDQHCVLYLELGLGMINITAPYTAFTLIDFPYAYASNILIDAATIAALESQGIFSIDTDFDYSLGGKSIVVRHFDNISSFLRDIADRFNENLKVFKSAYRTRGTTLIQQPYGIIGFRLIQLAPTWLARFGIGVTRWQG